MPSITPITSNKSVAIWSEAEKQNLIEEVFFGVPDVLTGGVRYFCCKAGDCTYCQKVVGHDNHRANRIRHVKQMHADWERLLQEHQSAKAPGQEGNRLAEAMRIAEYKPTGNVRKDEAAMLFVFAVRSRVSFRTFEDEFCRAMLRTTLPHSRAAVAAAGKTLMLPIVSAIKEKLPSKFGLVLDSWHGPQEHYLAVFASFASGDESLQLLLGLLPLLPKAIPVRSPANVATDNGNDLSDLMESVTSLFEETVISNLEVIRWTIGAETYLEVTKAILERYDKTISNVTFMVADNARVNGKLARLMHVPHIPCHAHLLNSAIQAFLDPHKDLIERVNTICSRVRNRKALRQIVKKATKLLPIVKPTTIVRWRAVFEMLQRYVRIRGAIPFHEDSDLERLQLLPREDNLVSELVQHYICSIQPLMSLLDSDHVELIYARGWCESLAQMPQFSQSMDVYLGPGMSKFSPEAKVFAEAVVKAAKGETLDDVQQDMLDSLGRISNPGNTELASNRGIFVRGFSRAPIRTLDEQALRFIPASTSRVERLFSSCSSYLTRYRSLLGHESIESLVFVLDHSKNSASFLGQIDDSSDHEEELSD